MTCTALALSPDGSYLATGDSMGGVNIYSRPAGLLAPLDLQQGSGMQPATPSPLKTLMNLTTAVDSLSFSHDSQVLLMGSRLKKESLRLVHMPSLSVFSNWPTSKSPLHYVHCAAFSPHSGFLGIGNAKGRVLLYRLHHYPSV
jgi:U3 small nucleolar RNA-associated protein 18